jgi:hypothetical protein
MSHFGCDKITETRPTDLHVSPVKKHRLKVFGGGVKYCF